MSLTKTQQKFMVAARATFPNASTLTAEQVRQVADGAGLNLPQWLTNDRQYRVSRGVYRLPDEGAVTATAAPAVPAEAAPAAVEVDPTLAFTGGVLVPQEIPNFQVFGSYTDYDTVIRSGEFYPVLITGRKGYGKTTSVQQACAANGREFYRVNITAETSEDDLLGGFRLVNGNMVWIDGPVVVAMKRGGILLLDEFEFGTSKMLCLQPVLEGKPVFLKKTNTWVHPAKGFNILATGNTKGDGDETGRYIGTNPMNAAFLDRFAETVEHLPPSEAVELKIVKGALKDAGVTDDAFAKNIVKWAARTRMDFVSGDANEEVSTRRLEYLVKAYAIYGDRLKAVQKVIARFDETAKAAFEKYYIAIDDEATKELAQANAAADNLGQPPTEDTATAATAATDDATVTVTATPVPF